MAKESEYHVTLNWDQVCEIVEKELRLSLRYAEQDYKNHPKFAGPETKAYIKAVKVVIDRWSHPDKWGKYD